eukprot:1515114-Rhodomonas_salina.1
MAMIECAWCDGTVTRECGVEWKGVMSCCVRVDRTVGMWSLWMVGKVELGCMIVSERDCLISTSKYSAPFELPCTAMWQLIAQLRPPAVVSPPRSAHETVAYVLWASSYAAVP